MTIGKSYESTKIEVQEFSANRPPAKEGIKVVSKNKPKKVLMCNYSANKIGAHGFSDKKLGPIWGAVYRKWKIKNHFQDSKIDQRSVNNYEKGIQEKHSDHKQSKSSTKQFVLRVEEDGEDSL